MFTIFVYLDLCVLFRCDPLSDWLSDMDSCDSDMGSDISAKES